MMKKLNLLIVFFYMLQVHAQIDSINYSEAPFIKPNLNLIKNDTTLYPFYDKLLNISYHKQDVIKILHIGDSHIQADFFSGKIREYFQVKYGNAGRGLIFPYRAAGSNEPSDINSSSKGDWTSKRNVHINNPLPLGISGFTLHTDDFFAELHIETLNKTFNNSFNKITLFHQKGDSCYDFALYDKNNQKIGYINSNDKELNRFTSTVKIDRLVNTIKLRTVKTSGKQYFTNIYGIALENSYPGVLYNTVAANGAAIYHYNQADYFAEQLRAIEPDLIIISLGSNEALNPPFFRKFFQKQISQFVNNLKKSNPNTCIVFTTPPDSYLKKRFKNKNVEAVRTEIVDFCEKENIAYWDLYEITGGYGSMDNWLKYKLAQRDKIHYTAKGYYIQANLFLQSLEKSLERFENIYR